MPAVSGRHRPKLPLAGDLGGSATGGSEGTYGDGLGANGSRLGYCGESALRASSASDRAEAPLLPCLSSNNSTEPTPENPLNTLSAQHRKSASALAWNVKAMCEKHGIERVGFLTLTFADHVLDPKEAQRRFNSLSTHVLRSRYRGHVRVFERQKSGRIHYHLLVALDEDIRTGVDIQAVMDDDFRTATRPLRAEWNFWRRTAKEFGFGRTQLVPIISTSEAIGRYVGKYISKHIGEREERDKGVRLVEYSGGSRVANTKFAWATPGGAAWRHKVGQFAQVIGERNGICSGMEYGDLSKLCGPRWAYWHREAIEAMSGPAAPSPAPAGGVGALPPR